LAAVWLFGSLIYNYHLWFSSCTPVPSTNKTDFHNMTEALLKVVLNIIIF